MGPRWGGDTEEPDRKEGLGAVGLDATVRVLGKDSSPVGSRAPQPQQNRAGWVYIYYYMIFKKSYSLLRLDLM